MGNPNEELRFGVYVLDIWTRRVYVGEKWVKLTEAESVIFRVLAESPDGLTGMGLNQKLEEFDGKSRNSYVGSALVVILRRKLQSMMPYGFNPIKKPHKRTGPGSTYKLLQLLRPKP